MPLCCSWAHNQRTTFFYRDADTDVFVNALLTIAKKWDQPRYPSADGWIKCGSHV